VALNHADGILAYLEIKSLPTLEPLLRAGCCRFNVFDRAQKLLTMEIWFRSVHRFSSYL